MDGDPNAALSKSFDALESAFTDESRRLVRQIKFEWQKIIKLKEDLLMKEEELMSAKTTLIHLNEIKEKNAKYIKVSESRIEDLQRSSKQLKSKLSILRKEEERSAKKNEEYKTYMRTKINFFLEKWNQRYESHYSKYPKIKEKEQVVKELEQVRMKSYELDEVLRKHEKELFRAKCERNKRSMEESRFYPFRIFVVNVAKIYLKTIRENEECQKLKKERQITEKICSPQKKPEEMEKNTQFIGKSKTSNDITGYNSISKQIGSCKEEIEFQRRNINPVRQQEESSIESRNFISWNKEDKLQTITENIQEQSFDEPEKFSNKSSRVNKWLEMYKVYIPKNKMSLPDNENNTRTKHRTEEKKPSYEDSNAKDKCNFQNKFSVFDRITQNGTETLKNKSSKFLNPVSPLNCKSVEKSESLGSKNALHYSKFSISAVEEGKNNFSCRKDLKQPSERYDQLIPEECEHMELGNEKEIPNLRSSETLTSHYFEMEQRRNHEEGSKYFDNNCFEENQKNIMLRIVTPLQQQQNALVNQNVSIEDHSTSPKESEQEKIKLSARPTQVVTSVISPTTKENIRDIASTIKNQEQNVVHSSEVEPMEVDINSICTNEGLVEASLPYYPENKLDVSLNNLSVYDSGETVVPIWTNQQKKNESKYFRATGNDINSHCLQSTPEKKMSVETKGSHTDQVDRAHQSVENVCNTQTNAESQKIAYVSPTLQRNPDQLSAQNHAPENNIILNKENEEGMEDSRNDMQIQHHESKSAMKNAETLLGSNIIYDVYIQKDSIHEGNLQYPKDDVQQAMKEEGNKEEKTQNSNAEMKPPSSHSPTTSDYTTAASNFGTPKEPKLKLSANKESEKSEKASSFPEDSPHFSPFNAENAQSPGFNYSTRLMYQPSTSKATEPPTGGKINMFELSSFYGAEKTKAASQSKDSDEGSNDFLISAYEKYLTDSPEMMKGEEKNLFAFNDNDSPEKDTETGGFFPLFASEAGNEEKNDNPFNFNFGETSTVKSPEDTQEFKFLF